MQVARVVSQVRQLLKEKERREGRRISQRKLEVECGVSRTSLKNWLRGDATQFQQEQIVALCRYFDCEVGDLLKIDESDNPIV